MDSACHFPHVLSIKVVCLLVLTESPHVQIKEKLFDSFRQLLMSHIMFP